MESGTSDPWGLTKALAGDPDAWAGIVDEFAQSVWNWARAQGLNREDAEDVCQTVWYRLKDKGSSIRDPRTLAGWLATTTRREAIRVAKRRESATDGEILERLSDPTDNESDPEHVAAARDLQQRLVDAFKKLREMCREILSLCWHDELSYKEIAVALDRSIGSIGPSRQRCLDDLRRLAGVT